MQQNGESCMEVYKDVVIIGNGPSGICLSYMLAGNWPHYTGEAHPVDDMLTARLRCSVATQTTMPPPAEPEAAAVRADSAGAGPVAVLGGRPDSACRICQHNQRRGSRERPGGGGGGGPRASRDERTRAAGGEPGPAADCLLRFSGRADLERLSEGLEGRNGGKPLSLLMDQLQRPCLDAGLDVEPLIDWRSPEEHAEHRVVEHVVLGKGPPGGTWHSLDPNVLTISSNRWMSLPGLDLRKWESDIIKEAIKDKSSYFSENKELSMNCDSTRVTFGTVAAYYKDYVIKQGLEKYFRCGTVVTLVKPISGVPNTSNEYGWLVQGYELESSRPFRYRCKNVVLATGATDSSNRLGVSGEETYNWITHNFKDFEKKLDQLNSSLRTSLDFNEDYRIDDIVPSKIEPVLIVGSGLSAADAIMDARFRGVPVIHAFRNRNDGQPGKPEHRNRVSLDRLKWLPASLYPEYHQVYEMMSDGGRSHPLYQPLPDHAVVEFSVGADKYARAKTKRVTLCTPEGRLISYRVSSAAILIGSKPDLSYLQNSGIGLGKKVDKPIDNRSNHIEVDVFTYEVERAPRKGLYAIGPLAGDNFVRFILGGAYGVLANVINTSK